MRLSIIFVPSLKSYQKCILQPLLCCRDVIAPSFLPGRQVTRYTLIHFSAYGIKRNFSEREIFPLQVCAMTAQVAGGACRGACERHKKKEMITTVFCCNRSWLTICRHLGLKMDVHDYKAKAGLCQSRLSDLNLIWNREA